MSPSGCGCSAPSTPCSPTRPDDTDRDVPDPYYGGDDGFAEVVAIVERTCRRLLQELEALAL